MMKKKNFTRMLVVASIAFAAFFFGFATEKLSMELISVYADEPDETEEDGEEGEKPKNKYALWSNPAGTIYCCGEGNVRPSCGSTPKCK